MKNKFIDVDNSREDDQREVMKNIMKADHCPFCLENLKKYHKQPLIKTGKYWVLTANQWPYKHTKHHFLAIYKEHIENLAGIDPEAGKELIEFVQYLEKEYSVKGGGWAMRFGDTDYSAGTVAHIHIQFVVPDIKDPKFEPCRLKIGKDWKKRK